jgi:hypothetical protein
VGASEWQYVVPCEGGVEESLAALHAQVFQVLYGASGEYGSVQGLWGNNEFMGETGTHTILDVGRVVHSGELPEPGRIDDYGTLRPLRRERILYHFGTRSTDRGPIRAVACSGPCGQQGLAGLSGDAA